MSELSRQIEDLEAALEASQAEAKRAQAQADRFARDCDEVMGQLCSSRDQAEDLASDLAFAASLLDQVVPEERVRHGCSTVLSDRWFVDAGWLCRRVL